LVLLGVVVLALAAGLVVASTLVWRATRVVEQDIRAIGIVEELDRALREHQRLGNLRVATGRTSVDASRSALETDMRRMLRDMQTHVSDATESRLLKAVSENIYAYIAERRALETLGIPLSELVQRSRPAFERTLASSAALRRNNEDDLRRTKRDAEGVLRFQYVLAIAATIVLLLGLVLAAIGVRRFVLGPVLSLEVAISRFREGDVGVRAEAGHPQELRRLAVAFNEMTDAITGQRRDQLTFLAAVAHDLRNPLWVLKMLVQSLEQAPRLATPERLGRLDRQLDRLTRMIGDLLDAARIEAGQLELKLETLELQKCAQSIVELHRLATTAHEVRMNVPTEAVVVRADPLRIEQVINNLLSNAIKYSPDGGCVEVAVRDLGDRVELAVSDQGVGIAPDVIPTLFEPFRRGPSTIEAIPGAGLGLSIVRRIVRAHGGDIEVESEPGVGSTFRVWLPREPQPADGASAVEDLADLAGQ
jgi:signal transduction histidine kinase